MKRDLIRAIVISLAIVVGWLIVGSFYATQDLLFMQARGVQVPVAELLSLLGIITVLWVLLTPFILYVTQFVRLQRTRLFRSIVFVAALILGFAVVRVFMGVAFVPLLEDRMPTGADVIRGFSARFHANVTLAGIVVVARLIWDVMKEIREKERRQLVLEGQLTRVQLDQLKGQLHPHFLFNALNGIATLVHTDARKADRMLMELSALLRSSLDLGTDDLIPLSEELMLLDRYLNIQQMRFGDRLTLERSIAPEVLTTPVPPFILQPLVENSLRHVIERRPGGGLVRIEGEPEGESIRIAVVDDGAGFDPEDVEFGVGISNVRGRLEQLYEGEARLEFRRDQGLFHAEITLPGGTDEEDSRADRRR